MKFLEEKFVPFAAKVGAQKHLACIRDSFVVIMPLTIAGALGVLLNNFHTLFAPSGLNMPAIQEGYSNFLASSGLGTVFAALNNGTIAMMAVLLAGMLTSKLTAVNGGDAEAGFVVGLAGYLCGVAQNYDALYADGTKFPGAAIDAKLLAADGLFVAMIFGLLMGTLFPKLSNNPKLQIKMPDGVPPAVSKSFSSMIPAIIVMLVVAAIYGYAEKFTGMNVWQIVTKFLSTPLQGLSQNVIMVIVMYFMIDLLWIFGLHGANIVGSVTTPILTPLSNANVNRFANGEEPLNTVVGGLQSGFAFLGGSGATLGCIIAIFIFSKSKASKTIAQLALAPGLFEINEPLTFGLPIVMNMVLAIPFIIGPIVLGVVTFYLMESGIIRRPCIEAPWVTPPVLIGFLCTGGDIKGAIWNVVEIVLLTVLWTPFIIMNDKVEAGNA